MWTQLCKETTAFAQSASLRCDNCQWIESVITAWWSLSISNVNNNPLATLKSVVFMQGENEDRGILVPSSLGVQYSADSDGNGFICVFRLSKSCNFHDLWPDHLHCLQHMVNIEGQIVSGLASKLKDGSITVKIDYFSSFAPSVVYHRVWL